MIKPDISALIVARDEAENLAACLDALSWTREIVVVVDAASRDATQAIARSRGARVAVRPFDDFASQRNAALAMAAGRWVLAVDADERVTPALREEIRRLLTVEAPPHAGYRVPIRSHVLGRAFCGSGTQDDRPLRLFRRDLGRWVGAVHETVDLGGTAGQLENALEHRTLATIAAFLRKIETYTTLEARRSRDDGRRFRLRDLLARPAWIFLKLYLGKRGYRDGLEGFAFCALSGVSAAVRAWKVRELELGPGDRDVRSRPSSTVAVGPERPIIATQRNELTTGGSFA